MRHLVVLTFLFLTFSHFSQMIPEKMNKFYEDLGMLPFNEKIDKIDKALKKKPKEPWYYWMKADVYQMMDDEAKTLENYNKSLEIDSNFSAGHASLSRYLYTSENAKLEEALIHINKAIALEPTEKYYHIDRGNIYRLSGNYDLALAEATTVFSSGEEAFYQEAIELVVESLHAQGRKDDLKAYLQKNDFSTYGFMNPNFNVLLGDLYLEYGDKEKACRCYNASTEAYLMMETELPANITEKLALCK